MLPERVLPPEINQSRLERYRLDRIQSILRERDIAFCLITSPISLRYAIGFREYALFQSHIPMFYLFVPQAGPVVMHGVSHEECNLVDEYLPSRGLNPFDSGLDITRSVYQFTDDVKAYLARLGISPSRAKIAAEALPTDAYQALSLAGIELVNGDVLVEQARAIKSSDEIRCIRFAIEVAQKGMDRMRSVFEPGITENQLWSILTQFNTANNGDWHDGRMLASGQRTNPWLQESSDKTIQNGELVGFDTDMIGPFGYCADISRTWLCGDQDATASQRQAYRHAYDEVHHNIEQIKPGQHFTELVEKTYPRREEYIAHRYPCVFHGVGMSDEYPKLYYPEDGQRQYEGIIEPNMVLCVESFSGSIHGGEGVKLEQMVLVTDTGCEVISDYPFESSLL